MARRFRAAAVKAPALARVIVLKTAYDTETTAKQLAAVDTGTMMNSIGFDLILDGLGFEIGPTVDYAVHQEFGTWKMAPHPFMNPAADKHFPAAEKALSLLVERVLK